MSIEKLFSDNIAKLCLEHFNTLPKCGKPSNDEWTILSCIVKSDNNKLDLIALGTGTKCIGQNKMSDQGDVLNDSHAEVVCRRAFVRYLYENMLSENNDVLRFNTELCKFVLKEDVKFHFFTTHVPCGDAAIFGKDSMEHFGEVLINADNDYDEVEAKRRKLEEKISEDIYRTGAKCLETDDQEDPKLPGVKYHVTGAVRIKPGRGVRTLSLSCSDKIAKWCHLGVQGALLSTLIDKPVYLSSFIVAGGTPYNEEAMERAFFNRLGNVTLEEPYHRNKLTFGQANLTFAFSKSNKRRPCPSSIIWTRTNVISNRQTEVAVNGRKQGLTKKQMKTCGMLRICKKELFKCFVDVVKKYNVNIKDIDNLVYKEAKLLSKLYQKCWFILKTKHFKVWTTKNENLLKFNATSYNP